MRVLAKKAVSKVGSVLFFMFVGVLGAKSYMTVEVVKNGEVRYVSADRVHHVLREHISRSSGTYEVTDTGSHLKVVLL